MGDFFNTPKPETTPAGSKSAESTTTQKLTKEQKKLLGLAMPTFEQFAAAPPTPYSGQTVAEFDPSQTAGQEQVLGAVPAQQQIASNVLGTQNFLSNDVLYPETNPALRQHAEAAVQPLYQNLTEAVLPAVRGGAYTTGGFGGSRQGIAEGLASGRTAQAAGATTSDIYSTAYGQGLDAMVKGAALTPTFQSAQTQPGITTSGVGDVRQARDQALLDAMMQNYYSSEWTPYYLAKDFANLAQGIPGGSTTTQQSAVGSVVTPQQSGLDKTLQVAGTVASVLPLFFSDRELKRDIEKIGALFDGTPVYRFRYKDSNFLQIGLMADEVGEEAKVMVGDHWAVNYELATNAAANIGKQKEQ